MGDNHKGTCGKCGKPCHYVSLLTRGYWVHDDNGDFMSDYGGRHDCNTYIYKESEK